MTDSKPSRISGTLVTIAALLCLLGVGVSVLTIHEHILYQSGIESSSSYCSISETVNCKAVLASRYSKIGSVPLGHYGCFFYFLLFFYVVFFPRKKPETFDALFFFTILSFLVSILLFFISAVIIRAFCPLCVATYVINIALLFVFYWMGRSRGLLERVANGGRYVFLAPILLFQVWKDVDKPQKKFIYRIANFCLLSFVLSYAVTPVLFLGNAYFMADLATQKTSEKIASDEAERALLEKLFGSWPRTPRTPASFTTADGPSKDLYVGSLDAPVYVVEYIDIECPACRHFFFALKEAIKPFQDKVLLVVKHYPLDNTCNKAISRALHPYACMGAELSRCAGEQGQYKETFEYLMHHKGFEEEGEASELLESLYSDLSEQGLDGKALKECMDSDRQLKEVLGDIEEGTELDIRGTPAIFVNGKLVPSKQMQYLPSLISYLLSVEGRE